VLKTFACVLGSTFPAQLEFPRLIAERLSHPTAATHLELVPWRHLQKFALGCHGRRGRGPEGPFLGSPRSGALSRGARNTDARHPWLAFNERCVCCAGTQHQLRPVSRSEARERGPLRIGGPLAFDVRVNPNNHPSCARLGPHLGNYAFFEQAEASFDFSVWERMGWDLTRV